MRHLAALLCLLSAPAMAQSNPSFITGQIPTAAQWNSYFGKKADVTGGTINNGVLNSVTINGSLGGSPTVGGVWTASNATLSGFAITGGTFSGTQAGTLTLSGTLNAQGGTTNFGTNTVAATNNINGPASTAKLLRFQSVGVNTWQIQNDTSDRLAISPFSGGVNQGVLLQLTNVGAITLNPNNTAAFNAAAFTSNLNNNFFAKGTVQLPNALVSTAGTGFGPGGNSPALLWGNTALSGTNTTGAGTPYFMQITDTMVGQATLTPLMLLQENYNAGADGPRGVLDATLAINSGSVSGNQNAAIVRLFGHFDAFDGGTSLTPKGGLVGINPDVRCLSPCDYLTRLATQENDLRLEAGTHALVKNILALHYGVGDAAHGTNDDEALIIDATPTLLSGTGGGTVGIAFGSSGQAFPLDPSLTTSALLQIEPNTQQNLQGPWQPYAGFGIDLRYLNAITAAFISPGFSVDGGGQLNLGPATLTYSANTATLDAPNVAEVSAVVAAGGASGYKVGDELRDTIGGLWTVASISGSGGTASVATVTLLHAGYASACPVSPTATTGGSGSANATLTVTCSVATKGIKLAGASTALGFYGTTPIVKATPVGACAGSTGCQALRDAIGALGLINTGSITN